MKEKLGHDNMIYKGTMASFITLVFLVMIPAIPSYLTLILYHQDNVLLLVLVCVVEYFAIQYVLALTLIMLAKKKLKKDETKKQVIE